MTSEINKIEKALLSQPSYESFISKKLFYLNTNKIDRDYATSIEVEFIKINGEVKKEKCKKSILKLLKSFKFNEAEKEYTDNIKYIGEAFYFNEISKAKENYDLYNLSNEINAVRENNESNLAFECIRGDLSSTKSTQYNAKLIDAKKNGKWEECNTWMYIASEYVFELWLKKKGIEYVDYNINNMFHSRDYRINNIDIDVKTTIGIGRRYLPKYNNVKDIEEIMVGVGSRIKSRDHNVSNHYIHGIYDKSVYENIDIKLKYYTHNKSYLNPCYFSSLDDYLKTDKKLVGVDSINNLNIVDEALKERKYLNALFISMNNEEVINALEIVLPECHKDLVPIINELLKKNKIYLLPHFLVDNILGKIVEKKHIESNAIFEIIYAIYRPYKYQAIYIDNLLKSKEAMNNIRCVNHSHETIDKMEVEYYMGSKPTLKACCSYDQKIKTTFYTYSWKTGETLAYGISMSNKKNNIPITCDSDSCGCLTHIHDGKIIGKRTCKKYGDNTV